jgi:glycosyltransferase involved in cell wall biosynthesis
LTVFVIAHSDSQKLLATIDRIYNALAVTIEDLSVVVFDDGSTDDTLAVAKAVWWFFIVPPASPAR